MPHHADLILTLTGGLAAALLLGVLTQKLRLSPIVGYLLAGILVGPFTPGFVANHEIATQSAEIGVILLMFGVGLHFRVQDLLAVRRVAIPGALVQIAAATGLGIIAARVFGWPWDAGMVFGLAISVASTVVLMRVLEDNGALHSAEGHIAIGCLIVEDLFTVVVLVLLPAFFGGVAGHGAAGNPLVTVGMALLKLVALVVFTFTAGTRLVPLFLRFVARTGSRELFTLTVLVLALGIALGAARFFGASMALGAFLAGMIVAQSDFSARAASEALQMRDPFAVLFFVSVGMLFDPAAMIHGWPLMLATLGIIMVGKPLVALLAVLALGRPLRAALSIAISLAQIGEFSFILAALGATLKILPEDANHALVGASIISITLNPLLYRGLQPGLRWLEKRGRRVPAASVAPPAEQGAADHAIVIGYGPVGKMVSSILLDHGLQVMVVELDIDLVQGLLGEGRQALYGDAAQREILQLAGIEKARSLVIAASSAPAMAIVQAARELNPRICILTRAHRLTEAVPLRQGGADAVFSGEEEIAHSMGKFLTERPEGPDTGIAEKRPQARQERS